METSLVISGFGGQGVLLIGNLIACAAMREGKNVAYMPSYGVEMRGGAAMCTVVVSNGVVGSPVVGYPDALIAFTDPALKKFGPQVKSGGLLIVNTAMADPATLDRNDIKLVPVNFRETAESMGNPRGLNMIALGVYLASANVVKLESVELAFPETIDEKYHKFIPSNMEAIKKGMEIGRSF